jgi:hypothetical protein
MLCSIGRSEEEEELGGKSTVHTLGCQANQSQGDTFFLDKEN